MEDDPTRLGYMEVYLRYRMVDSHGCAASAGVMYHYKHALISSSNPQLDLCH